MTQAMGSERVHRVRPDSPGDLVVRSSAEGRVVIEAKFQRYGSFALRRGLDQVAAIRNAFDRRVGVLVATNAPLAGEVQEYNMKQIGEADPVEIVTWNGSQDDDLLARAINRLCHVQNRPASPATVRLSEAAAHRRLRVTSRRR